MDASERGVDGPDSRSEAIERENYRNHLAGRLGTGQSSKGTCDFTSSFKQRVKVFFLDTVESHLNTTKREREIYIH
jgi:hypothetical protein